MIYFVLYVFVLALFAVIFFSSFTSEEPLVDEALWKAAAEKIDWFQPPSAIIGRREGPNPFRWFPDGKLNTCYNCLDRHIPSIANQTCLIYDSPVMDTKLKFTYQQVLDKVQTLAGVLKSHGVQKGDVVLIYMPTIPEAFFTLLACARLGAIHCAVFGGSSSKELSKRIDLSQPKVIMTASCGIEAKRIIPYKPLLESALQLSEHHVPVRVVVQRKNQVRADMREGDYDYNEEMERIVKSNAQVKDCTPVDSNDPLYILFTSGTTGLPKGAVRTNGGHAVVIRWATEHVFNIRKGDTFLAYSDVAWGLSHACAVYGPTLVGATSIFYEGKSVGTPDAGSFWRLASEYGIKTMIMVPAEIRAMICEDPKSQLAKKYDLSGLTSLFMGGERSDSKILKWCQNTIGEQCAVIDNYWSTESGSPTTAICAGIEKNTKAAVKWGSAGKAVPGSKVCILDEKTSEPINEPNKLGSVVIKLPLPPGAFYTLWNDHQRYKTSYFDKYPGYYDTGDTGMIDEDGFVYIISRVDDSIKVAGHQISTGFIEQVMNDHPDVAECCAVPVPDAVKGYVTLGIVVCKNNEIDKEKLLEELVEAVGEEVGVLACFSKVVFVSQLPKSKSGKILRKCMRELLSGKPIDPPSNIENEDHLYGVYRSFQQNLLVSKEMKLYKV